MMKNTILYTVILGLSISSQAVETYFSEDRTEEFACTIARSIRDAYPSKTRRQLRKDILKILREDYNPWVDAHPIPAGISLPKFVEKVTGIPGLPMDRSEYWLQNAFISYGNPNLELREETENYFASYIHLARNKHIAYLNGEIPKFKLREEEDLVEQIEEHLPTVANYAYPHLDENGKAIEQQGKVKKEKNRYRLAIGDTSHEKYDKFVYESQRANKFASPLFMWLLDQKDFSISPEKLFQKSLEIYEDPFVALGVIPWIFSGDALTVNRGTSSVVSYKMERLVEGNDIPGFQYHFWGYLTQAMIGNRIRVGALAYIYERLYQKDIPDWKVDLLALRLGKEVRKNLKTLKRCH